MQSITVSDVLLAVRSSFTSVQRNKAAINSSHEEEISALNTAVRYD